MKIIGLILTYNCANIVEKAIKNIPPNILSDLICCDDGSKDNIKHVMVKNNIKFFSHNHLGYGGNLYYGLKIAFSEGASHVVEIHGDGQYDLSKIIEAKKIIENSKADLILGNRFYDYKKPLENKMDMIRYMGNICVTFFASLGLGIRSKDLFPGFRVYSLNFFKSINFNLLSNYYWFSFEIIALSVFKNLRISSIPIDCDYKGEHSSMSLWKGFSFIYKTIKIIIQFRLAKLNFNIGIFK